MNKIKILCALSLILTLSACSSSGGGGGGGGGPVGLSEALSKTPGASFDDDGDPINNNPIDVSTLADVVAALGDLETEIDDGSLVALSGSDFPTSGSATLNGYVGIDVSSDKVRAFGHLTIVADFLDGSVVTTATDFKDFNLRTGSPVVNGSGVSGGILRGTGTITATTITSTLNGRLMTDFADGRGGIDVLASFMDGKVYEDDDGALVVHGKVVGQSRLVMGDGHYYNTNGDFAASGAIEPSE